MSFMFFILPHSKRLMNDVIMALDGFKKKKKLEIPIAYIYTMMIMKKWKQKV